MQISIDSPNSQLPPHVYMHHQIYSANIQLLKVLEDKLLTKMYPEVITTALSLYQNVSKPCPKLPTPQSKYYVLKNNSYKSFGFGQVTGTGFPGESAGVLRDYARWRTLEQATLATWDTTGLTPGEYRLRLTVVDQTGNYGPHDEIGVMVGG